MHLVHSDCDGNLAVVGIMIVEGTKNKQVETLWKHMPAAEGEKNPIEERINLLELLPAQRKYYRFNGSLTTPPCSEGVSWYMMQKPITMSKEQIETFKHIMHHNNNRPVQEINARPILTN